MMVSNRTLWTLMALAAGAGLAAVLMPPVRARRGAQLAREQSRCVDEASEDSFPASDPPSYTPSTAAPGPAS